jgi:hypothetical protein
MLIGRVQVIVPGAAIIPSTWAMPCVPWAGINTGMFMVPPMGAGVGSSSARRPDYPIWTGGFWGAGETPVMAKMVPPLVPGITIQTTLKNGITISDVPGPTGGILIQTTTGAMISVSDIGIIISNGKGAIINMTGPTVDVNLGALTIV